MRLKKIVASIICIVALLGTSNLTALAFNFEFENVTEVKYTSYVKKTNNDSKWVISLYEDYGQLNFSNLGEFVFGCKMHRKTNDNVDRYHTFSKYVRDYGVDYKSSVSKGDKMRLAGKQDDSKVAKSKWGPWLTITGSFTP